MENSVAEPSPDGGNFDVVNYIKLAILRFLSWIFSIVVFGAITNVGYFNPMSKQVAKCMFNNSDCTCDFAVGIGVLAFLACIMFSILDCVSVRCSAEVRKHILIVDLAFSGAWTFLWMICFGVLANQWTKTDSRNVTVPAAQAAIAFSFFSVITWAFLAYFAYGRYRQSLRLWEWLVAFFSSITGRSN